MRSSRRSWTVSLHATCAVIVGSAVLGGCAGENAREPVVRPDATVDRHAAKEIIARELDDFHDAAARADEARYFAHFSPDAVFLGTDGTERWTLEAFHAFARPYFAKHKAWSFHATRRSIDVVEGGRFAYFDEDLATEKLGPARGSGVLVLQAGAWKIAQYNLTTVIPNDRFGEVRALLDRPSAAPRAPFEERYHAAYDRATAAAARGEMAVAERELEALADEALDREGDDTAFWLHNELTWLRWAQGDLIGALGEVDRARSALVRARLSEEKSARVGLHEKWDRAYLLLELARTAPPTLRSQALSAAEAARTDYERAARPLGDADGMAVLDAFFAVRTSDGKKAMLAAKRVDADKDDDLQDIYVLALAYGKGGDRAQALELRRKIREGRDYLMKPLLVRQLDADAAAKIQ